MSTSFLRFFYLKILISCFLVTLSCSQNNKELVLETDLKLYPYEYNEKPDYASPFNTKNGNEFAVCKTGNGKFTIIPVTVENGKPFNYSGKNRGKGNQLYIDKSDFPTLAETGLHSEQELLNTISITGKSIAEITLVGRPERMSGAGFMADDEDIISVISGDNRLVSQMDLKHPDFAGIVFHLWNIIRFREDYRIQTEEYGPSVDTIFYNDKIVKYTVPSCRGWQYSLFNDSIQGECHLELKVSLTNEEKNFISDHYKHLNEEQLKDFIQKLTHLHTGEMAAYYIQRYGFYEGHTGFRADPVVLAFIFGLKSIEELHHIFDGKAYEAIINHHKTIFE